MEIRVDNNVFRHWWLSLIVGIIGIIAGICCFVTPVDSIIVLTDFFVIFMIVGGIFNIVTTAFVYFRFLDAVQLHYGNL